MTLQIAWSGIAPSQDHPETVPRWPSLRQERFMAYEAIVDGARGLMFFGGHMTEVCTPDDAASGWNWTFWREVLRPLVRELSSPELRPALVAPDDATDVRPKTARSDIEIAVRRGDGFLYVIAVKRGGDTARIQLVGLPKKADGTALTSGEVLFEYVQSPPPLPRLAGHQIHRHVPRRAGRLLGLVRALRRPRLPLHAVVAAGVPARRRLARTRTSSSPRCGRAARCTGPGCTPCRRRRTTASTSREPCFRRPRSTSPAGARTGRSPGS